MCSTGSAWTLLQAGCPIRTSTDQRLLPASRRLSQVAASFFGSWCLGIHLRPLVACPSYNHSSINEESLSGWYEDPLLTAFGFKRRSLIRNARLVNAHFTTYSVVNVHVDMRGLEPLTPCLQSRCSPS